MLTVACVLKSGGIYDATWVERLQAGVKRHLPLEHRFVCLSDVDVPCERIPLEHNWPGWWSKIELFRLTGEVLYFDLDTAIVGDLSGIASVGWPGLKMLRDFYAPDHFGSGVMAWNGDLSAIYDAFAETATVQMMTRRERMGDQAFIEEEFGRDRVCPWQAMSALSGQIVSYKVHCREGIPPNARVVCLHGFPKFGDMPVNDPVRQAWEMAA
jgi:hypothetical protein